MRIKICGTFRQIALVLAVILFQTNVFAQLPALSPQSKASLVTVGPGQELYSGFGHSVLWIYDPVTGIDRAYNYGTFRFEEGNFYVKFLRGTLPYSLSVSPFGLQAEHWKYENRSISEQILNLTLPQKQRLFQFLETNYLPENRQYQYKFFYDNCSTRMSGALKAACGDSLIYNGYTKEKLSFRQWIDKYAYKQKPWADFGMDLAIGNPSDEIATADQATFLPDNMAKAFADAKVKTATGTVPLVATTQVLFTAEPEPGPGPLTPTVVFWTLGILVLAFTYWQIKKEKINFTLDKVLFAVVGLAGWILLLLWFGTNHGVTSWNYDILWAFPFWLPVIFFLSEKKKPAWFQFFLIFYGFLLLCATGNATKHNFVVVPILLMLIVRVYYINNSLSKIPTGEKEYGSGITDTKNH
ncbi:lipoprotein N-acyltransferase Lnb domain-containing protein [Dyadobacter sp.]|uniref:lipoprotein N-acyltransferase Lnb domain-containing protein n=1 Tax=Dyadobacter sp. TaxID=1914288 RepID=UPI003F71B34F